MSEHEAIDLATKFLVEQNLDHGGLERAFFVPAQTGDCAVPGMRDEWVVHFRAMPVDDSTSDFLLSGDDTIVIAIDAETRVASVMWTL
jgi:hypothetical protein